MLKADKCRHFNGIQNKTCEAGIVYDENGGFRQKPCLSPTSSDCSHKWCEKHELPTQAEVDADEIRTNEAMAKTFAAIKVANAWRTRPKPYIDRTDVVECPICKGRLHLFQSCYNGHVHGQCETPDCVSWME